MLILEVDAERRRLSLSLKRVDADRRDESEGPIEGTPHLDLVGGRLQRLRLSATGAGARRAEAGLEAPTAGEDAVERESAPVGDEVDPAAADESAVPAEPVSDEH